MEVVVVVEEDLCDAMEPAVGYATPAAVRVWRYIKAVAAVK